MTPEERFNQTMIRLRDSIVSGLGELVIVQFGNLAASDPECKNKSVVRVHIDTAVYTKKISTDELIKNPEMLGLKIALAIVDCRFKNIFEAEISD